MIIPVLETEKDIKTSFDISFLIFERGLLPNGDYLFNYYQLNCFIDIVNI